MTRGSCNSSRHNVICYTCGVFFLSEVKITAVENIIYESVVTYIEAQICKNTPVLIWILAFLLAIVLCFVFLGTVFWSILFRWFPCF